MNLRQDFNNSPNDNNEDAPKYADDMMSVCMAEIHDMLMVPMQEKLSTEQHAVLALIGVTLKIIASKATELEKLEDHGAVNNSEIPFPTSPDKPYMKN